MPVVIDVSHSISARFRRLPMLVEFGPGLRFQLQPGQNQVLLAPGAYRAELYCQYAWMRVGRATLDIDTRYGPVWFSYAAPYTIYSAGAAGFQPQERPGRSAIAVIVAISVAVPLLVALFTLLVP